MARDSMTKLVFRLLSVGYIASIFVFAASPVIADLAPFNPQSLLHIPLYGILTFLLVFSISPYSTHSTNLTHSTRLIFSGVIALTVAIADEIHQAYVPGRNASVVDVFLDIGIALCLFAFKHFS
jgi:VanZ family protein